MSNKTHSKELEIRVIAALSHIGLASDLRVQEAMLNLSSVLFVSRDLQRIYTIIRELFDAKQDFSFVSLLSCLPKDLYDYTKEFIKDEYVSTQHLASDVKALNEYHVFRQQLKILESAIKDSSQATTPEESLDVITESIQKINETKQASKKSYVRTYEEIANEVFENGENWNTSEFDVDIPGLPGVPNRSLITIAGSSGHGKTFFALYLMDKIIDAQPGKQTLYFNLEMGEQVMMARHAKLLGVQETSQYKTITEGVSKLLPKNVSMVSEPMITIEQIEAECRLAALRQPLAVVVVDYLGIVQSKKKYDREDLLQAAIAKRLAAISLELDCVVILLIQINRGNQSREVGQRCPVVTDSASSMGSVHSSSWWLGIDQPQKDSDDEHFKDLFQVRCRKNRGDSGMFKLDLQFKDGMFSRWIRPYDYHTRTKGPRDF
jgi:replicative DNA helicase